MTVTTPEYPAIHLVRMSGPEGGMSTYVASGHPDKTKKQSAEVPITLHPGEAPDNTLNNRAIILLGVLVAVSLYGVYRDERDKRKKREES